MGGFFKAAPYGCGFFTYTCYPEDPGCDNREARRHNRLPSPRIALFLLISLADCRDQTSLWVTRKIQISAAGDELI
jgi:hypothetical protein